MSQGINQNELQEKTQKLLQGPLKHVRAAALAAALLPLASVAATPAAAQECTSPTSGGMDTVCGFVWNDTDGDGFQDPGESGIEGSTVTLGSFTYTTGVDGFYYFMDVPAGTYVLIVDDNQDGTQASPPDLGNDATDSDGMASVTVPGSGGIVDLDFGFTSSGESSDGEVSGVVWDDTNNNGIQDASEPGIEFAKVYTSYDPSTVVETDVNGVYSLDVPDGTYTIYVLIPSGTQPSPPNVVGGDETLDSDGVLQPAPDNAYSAAQGVIVVGSADADFGFFTPAAQGPGTGTPGYWKNHPEAWPVSSIQVGGITYSQAEAIAWLGKVGKDKTTTMFSSLVPAMLNVMILNQSSCVNSTIAAANIWMATYGPVGSQVAALSYAWTIGEPLHTEMDAYNNGLLCAPHRN